MVQVMYGKPSAALSTNKEVNNSQMMILLDTGDGILWVQL